MNETASMMKRLYASGVTSPGRRFGTEEDGRSARGANRRGDGGKGKHATPLGGIPRVSEGKGGDAPCFGAERLLCILPVEGRDLGWGGAVRVPGLGASMAMGLCPATFASR